MPDVTLEIDYTGEEGRRVRAELRELALPDARFLEEDEHEGRDQPVLRFEKGTAASYAVERAKLITRAAADRAGVSDTRIRASTEDPPIERG